MHAFRILLMDLLDSRERESVSLWLVAACAVPVPEGTFARSSMALGLDFILLFDLLMGSYRFAWIAFFAGRESLSACARLWPIVQSRSCPKEIFARSQLFHRFLWISNVLAFHEISPMSLCFHGFQGLAG